MKDKKCLSINQKENRHIINCPIPFTREQLTLLVKHCSGWEDQPEDVTLFVDHIIQSGEVCLNPSHELGDGANIADIFSFGFMAYMKSNFDIDVDPNLCWWHPMSYWVPTEMKKCEFLKHPVDLVSKPEHEAMTVAIEKSTGKEVKLTDEGIVYTYTIDSASHSTDTDNNDDLPF